MLELDGSAGGGQLVRTALTLSALTGEPFHMMSVRGARPESGLRPQHTTAVRAMAKICDASVEGNELGSKELSFEPDEPGSGEYAVDVEVGTAGSATLVCDTLLPLAFCLEAPLTVAVGGGTDVQWAPPVDYLRRVKLPLLDRFGLDADLAIERRGFYPAGGGTLTLQLRPSSISPLDLATRGSPVGMDVYSVAATDLENANVADRQARAAADTLTEAGLEVSERQATYVEADCPGSAVVIRAVYDRTLAGFDALGERGKPSEAVAGDAVAAALGFHAGTAAIDEHAADQLLGFLALAGGHLTTSRMTDHVETSVALLRKFDFDIETDELDDGVVHIRSVGEK